MPLNLEVKIKLEDFSDTLRILSKIDARYIDELNQKDIYYKTLNGLLKLRIENGREQLIKYNRDEQGRDRFSDYEILEISSSNGEKFLNQIFETEFIIEKKRLLYMFENTRIHLDSVSGRKGNNRELEYLGFFLELETLVLNSKNRAKTEFDKISNLLNLDLKNQIRKSYRAIIKETK